MLRSVDQPQGVSLRHLLPSAEFHGARDIRVTSCAGDSRICRPGDLFVALEGTRHDGHDFARHAAARGASAVLAERALPLGGLPTCIVPDTRKAYGQLCQALAGNPSHRLKVIGVTGTNGKTTTAALIAGVLEAAGCRTGIIGTLGYYDGVDVQPAVLTTPSAPMLATWLARMEANGCTHAVVEVSSHALSQARIAGIELDCGCVTNVRRDHLDYHGSLANYRSAKARLFDYLTPDALAVLNADDAVASSFLSLLDRPTLTVGLRAAAEITGALVERFKSEQTFLLSAGSDTVAVRTQMIGDHHIQNCLMAAAVGFGYGFDLATVVRGLESVGHVPGRLERIECGQPFGLFVDYAHTPHALCSALDALRDVTQRRLICVFGAGGERDTMKRPLMGRAVEKRADVVIVTTDNPRHENPETIVYDILAGCERPSQVELIADRAEAIHRALRLAEPGDCVLIAGKGHEAEQIIGNERRSFDDRDVARSWLYNVCDHEPQSSGRSMAIGNY